jgi:hypothetical protein
MNTNCGQLNGSQIKSEVLSLKSSKVMLGTSGNFLSLIHDKRGEPLSKTSLNVVLNLYKAIKARPVYEAAIELPLEDLFYIGGKLQTLINKAEFTLEKERSFLASHYPIETIEDRIKEAKEFKKYVITRIKTGK